jgi:dTDP-4-dehydrorhamnose reductase
VTWLELARRAADLAGFDWSLIEGRPMESFGFTARRPRYSALASARAALLPSLEHALHRYIKEAGFGQQPEVPAGERLEA